MTIDMHTHATRAAPVTRTARSSLQCDPPGDPPGDAGVAAAIVSAIGDIPMIRRKLSPYRDLSILQISCYRRQFVLQLGLRELQVRLGDEIRQIDVLRAADHARDRFGLFVGETDSPQFLDDFVGVQSGYGQSVRDWR